jgi:YegS/Rv2252/BmrU family lipid kinase
MTYTFILNPRSSRGTSERRRRLLERAIERAGIEAHILLTQHRGHAVDLARAASAESDVVVAVGGDGTVHEVVAGLVSSDREAHLAVVPAGAGNDFAKMFDLPGDTAGIVHAIKNASPTRVDYGRVHWSDTAGTRSGTFVNVAGAGIGAKVAAAASRFKLLTGTPRYVAAVLQTLRDWSAPEVEVELQCRGNTLETIRSEILLVAAGNGRCAAGGFYLTPAAKITDGRLDALIVRSATAARVLALIPSVLRGRHVDKPEVTIEKVEEIVVRPVVPLAIEADGEVLTLAAREIRFEIVAGGLSVVMPVKK